MDPKPVKSVVRGNNAALMDEVAKLWIRPRSRVLDMTYGQGMFWKKFRPRFLEPYTGDFLKTPFDDNQFHVVVYDPPYTSTGTKSKTTIHDFYDRYGLGDTTGWKNLFAENFLGLQECVRVCRPSGLIMVKTADYVESGHRRWGHTATVMGANKLGLTQVDEFILVSGTGAQPKKNLDGSDRKQVHSRRAHSFLCIFKR